MLAETVTHWTREWEKHGDNSISGRGQPVFVLYPT
jgi:hypothetical protein